MVPKADSGAFLLLFLLVLTVTEPLRPGAQWWGRGRGRGGGRGRWDPYLAGPSLCARRSTEREQWGSGRGPRGRLGAPGSPWLVTVARPGSRRAGHRGCSWSVTLRCFWSPRGLAFSEGSLWWGIAIAAAEGPGRSLSLSDVPPPPARNQDPKCRADLSVRHRRPGIQGYFGGL